MKITMIVVGFLFSIICLVGGLIYSEYYYSRAVGQYAQLADDASTPDVKLAHLLDYQKNIKEKITRNEARFIFKKERLTKEMQLSVLETLIKRLKETIKLTPDSFAYQQAMLQITGQEFDHALGEINGVFKACWLRQSAWWCFCLWFGWWVFAIIGILGIGFCLLDI